MRLFALWVSLLASATVLFAQPAKAPPAALQVDRRDRQHPEMMIEAGGPTGTFDVLQFSPDGKELLSAGDDKVVRIWPYSPKSGIGAGEMKVLRWPAWREQRGGIKAMDVSPDGKYVVVAGFGMENAWVAKIDKATAEVVAIADTYLDPKGIRIDPLQVYALRCSPDGKKIAIGTGNGSLWLWDGMAGKVEFLHQHKPPKEDKGFNRPRALFFTKPDQLLSIAQSGEIVSVDLSAKPPKGTVVADVNGDSKSPATIYRATLSPDSKWIAFGFTTSLSEVVLLNLENKSRKILPLGLGSYVGSLAFNKDGSILAVSAGRNVPGAQFRIEADDQISLFADPLSTREPKKTPGPKQSFLAEAMAFAPDGRLAVAGGDNHEVTLWDLNNPQKPVPPIVCGRGRCLWGVRLSVDGKMVGFQTKRDHSATDLNQRGSGDFLVFDLNNLVPYQANKQPPKWAPHHSEADGWSVEPVTRFKWKAVNQKEHTEFLLPTDEIADQELNCYEFVPAQGNRPTLLIVGHGYGCSVFDLSGKEAVRRFHCIGHAGRVMAVASSADGKWFISAGLDETLAAWSLEDWPSDPSMPCFGALIEDQRNQIVVRKVDVGSPAWEMGLLEGAVIDFIGLVRPNGRDKEYVYDSAGGHLTPAKAIDRVREFTRSVSGQQLFLTWHDPLKKAKPTSAPTTLKRRPLWKMFATLADDGTLGEWVVWSWHTGAYASSTHGDKLMGWHMNDPDMKKTPTWYPLNVFKEPLNKVDLVNDLIDDRDVAKMITRLRGTNPQPLRLNTMEPAPVSLTAPETATDRAASITVKVSVRDRGTNPDLMPDRVELWVNDHRLEKWEWNPMERGLSKTISIPNTQLRSGKNQLTVLTFNRLGGRGEEMRMVDCTWPPVKPKLYGIFVGINDYSRQPNKKDLLKNLECSKKDAEDLCMMFKKHLANYTYYAKSGDHAFALVDSKEVEPKYIMEKLEDARKNTGPDDMFVLLMSGHGDNIKQKEGMDRLFVFCGPKYDYDNPTSTGITSSDLFDKLVSIPARKLVFLDACHSGQAANSNLIRNLIPANQGPILITACGQGESALEDRVHRNSFFTEAILDALGPWFDAKAKGEEVDVPGLYKYLEKRVPELLEANKYPQVQHVNKFPEDLPRFVITAK